MNTGLKQPSYLCLVTCSPQWLKSQLLHQQHGIASSCHVISTDSNMAHVPRIRAGIVTAPAFFIIYTFCDETPYVNQQAAHAIQGYCTWQMLQDQFTTRMRPIFQICITLRVQCTHPRYMKLKVALYEQSESSEMRS